MIKQGTNSTGLPVKKPDTPGAMECSTGCQADRAALPVDSMVTESNQAAQDQMMECKMEEMTKAEVQDIKMETQGDTPLAKQLASNDLAGITPEELHTKTVLDITRPNLDILFVGINPGYHSALTGHHYSGTGNHFWTCLYTSRLIPEPFTADRDREVLQHGIGLCNVVSRTTASGQDLSSSEIREGCRRLVEKLSTLQPLVACFNGKSIWESFCREILPGTYKKRDFAFGRQDIAPLQGIKTVFYVMASSSARCAAFPTAETKLPFFREVKNIKDKLKSDESAKGLAGLASIGGNLPKFTGHDISPKVYSGSPRPPGMDDAKERKGKKRPIEESDHPKSKLKHMTKKDDGPVIPQHRLAGGGISTDMLKDPSENERMERVRKWVNNQDFSRASPEPPLPSDTTRADQQTQQDLYNALQKHMQPITMLHHGVHPFLSKPDYWPALGLSDERVLQSAYNLQGVAQPLAQTSLSAFQGLSSGLSTALAGGTGLPNNPGTAPWPYGALQSGVSPSLYRLPAISPYDWSKALSGAAGYSDASARVIPFVPVIPAQLPTGLSNSLQFVLPGQNPQGVIYPGGYNLPETGSKNPPQ